VVRDLFAWFADEGATILASRQRLARLGIASPRGYPTWNASALRGVLTNPAYVGQVCANRVRRHPAERRRSALLPIGQGTTGVKETLDKAEWIVAAAVPAIVGQAQFDRAQERLAYNRRMARRNNTQHPYLLRGLVSCGLCRRACAGRHTPRYDYYICRTKQPTLLPHERCPARHIPARPLETLVWHDLCAPLSAPEVIAHAMERARGGYWLAQALQARRANLRRGRAALDQQVERLTAAYLAGVMSLAEYERRRRETEARLIALDRQENDLLHDAERQDETARLASHAEAFCRRVREGLAEAGFDQKRALIELLIDRVIVTDGEVEIRYVVPTDPEGERHPFWRLRTDYQICLPGSCRRGSGKDRDQAQAEPS
jgi:site-specific DNA recombinase